MDSHAVSSSKPGEHGPGSTRLAGDLSAPPSSSINMTVAGRWRERNMHTQVVPRRSARARRRLNRPGIIRIGEARASVGKAWWRWRQPAGEVHTHAQHGILKGAVEMEGRRRSGESGPSRNHSTKAPAHCSGGDRVDAPSIRPSRATRCRFGDLQLSQCGSGDNGALENCDKTYDHLIEEKSVRSKRKRAPMRAQGRCRMDTRRAVRRPVEPCIVFLKLI